MKPYLILFALAFLTLSACGQKQEEAPPQAPEMEQTMPADTTEQAPADTTGQEAMPADTSGMAAALPEVVDGVQIVTVVVKDTGYKPAHITLKAGMPTRLIVEQRSNSECASEIQIPGLGVRKTTLPPGQKTVIEFIPEESGTFTFACGRNAMKGTILVRS